MCEKSVYRGTLNTSVKKLLKATYKNSKFSTHEGRRIAYILKGSLQTQRSPPNNAATYPGSCYEQTLTCKPIFQRIPMSRAATVFHYCNFFLEQCIVSLQKVLIFSISLSCLTFSDNSYWLHASSEPLLPCFSYHTSAN